MKTELILQNLKCEGCASTILKTAVSIEGISNPKINSSKSLLTVDFMSHNALMKLYLKLASIGYPVEGETNTIIDKAKSYVSCALGKFSSGENLNSHS